MAKKQKHVPDNGGEEQVLTQADVGSVAVVNGEAKEPLIPRNPTLFLQADDTGTQYKFDRRKSLPKAMQNGKYAGKVMVDGVETVFGMTSNKGWSIDADHVIEYIWLTIPNAVEGVEPISGFITLDYMQPAADFDGKGFTVGTGKPNRDNPARVGVDEKEATRKAAAAATLAKKKAEAEAAAAEQATAEAPAQ